MPAPLTVLFMPRSAYGPTYDCIGIGDRLLQRGHRVVFAAEASWRGRPAPLGVHPRIPIRSLVGTGVGLLSAGAGR